jgi:hypothetical protein
MKSSGLRWGHVRDPGEGGAADFSPSSNWEWLGSNHLLDRAYRTALAEPEEASASAPEVFRDLVRAF